MEEQYAYEDNPLIKLQLCVFSHNSLSIELKETYVFVAKLTLFFFISMSTNFLFNLKDFGPSAEGTSV